MQFTLRPGAGHKPSFAGGYKELSASGIWKEHSIIKAEYGIVQIGLIKLLSCVVKGSATQLASSIKDWRLGKWLMDWDWVQASQATPISWPKPKGRHPATMNGAEPPPPYEAVQLVSEPADVGHSSEDLLEAAGCSMLQPIRLRLCIPTCPKPSAVLSISSSETEAESALQVLRAEPGNVLPSQTGL
ncbi:hypothetical protein K439DRAFT_1536075 [Ramaria rubella]|nr:hypothetical protein K439DRAFT_1536075 [Ramaria rubella]